MPLPKLNGKLPLVGQPAPSLRYVGVDRATHDMQNLRGSVVILLTVLDKDGVIRYHELVPELGNEPNYEAALQAAKELL